MIKNLRVLQFNNELVMNFQWDQFACQYNNDDVTLFCMR